MTENEISYKIIGAVIELHKNIGAGLLESAYEAALAYERTWFRRKTASAYAVFL